MSVHVATDNAELRAAAYLRAAAFYHYPPDRSLFAMRVRTTACLHAHHIQIRVIGGSRQTPSGRRWRRAFRAPTRSGRRVCAAPEERVGRHSIKQDVRVTCLLATVPHTDETDGMLLQGDSALDRSGQLPAGPGHAQPRLVIGTLDTNQVGACMP